jgi:hypothetical protein
MKRLHMPSNDTRAHESSILVPHHDIRARSSCAGNAPGSCIKTDSNLPRSIVATFLPSHYFITMADLPKTYKACVYDQPGKISTKIVSLDMPEPGPGEVLVKL